MMRCGGLEHNRRAVDVVPGVDEPSPCSERELGQGSVCAIYVCVYMPGTAPLLAVEVAGTPADRQTDRQTDEANNCLATLL